jgi:hypothetical protein
MTEIWEIPRSLLRQKAESWGRIATTIAPSVVGNGFLPLTLMGGAGIWATNSDAINLRTPAHVRLWRSIEAYCDGGAQPIVVPMCDRRQFPAPLDVNGNPILGYDQLPYVNDQSADEPFHSDDTGFAQSVTEIQTNSAAVLGATSIQLFVSIGGSLRPGMFFSIRHPTWHWRLYVIRTAEETAEGSGAFNITFRPTLRETVIGGVLVEFDSPRCLMQLADPEALRLTIELRKFANPSWAFVEAPKPTDQ